MFSYCIVLKKSKMLSLSWTTTPLSSTAPLHNESQTRNSPASTSFGDQLKNATP